MNERGGLAPGLLWDAEGHASEWVLSALADGEDSLVPEAVSLHVDTCEACTERLGAMALLSLTLGDDLRAISEKAHAAFPKGYFAFALGVVGIGAWGGVASSSGMPFERAHELLVLLRGLRHAAPAFSAHLGSYFVVAAVVATLAALLVGITIARRSTLSHEKVRMR